MLAGMVLSAAPAAAAPPIQQAPQVSLAYTDEAAPTTSHPQPTGELPLGSWRDEQGAAHTSRVYASFDLTGFAAKDTGKHVVAGWLVFGETSAASYVPRTVEVWQTATPTAPVTWRRAPAEKKKLGTVTATAAGPASYLRLDLDDAAASAAASGSRTLSLELRLSDADEANPALGRRLNPRMFLYATSDTAPGTPTDLYSQQYACADKNRPYLGTLTPPLTAVLHDADPNDEYLTGTFAIWPSGHPEQRTEFTAANTVKDCGRPATVPPGVLADGGTYSWQVRGGDGTELSAWSKPCTFHVDVTSPAAAPVVTSANFPEGQVGPGGVPAEFTITSNGTADVEGYQYGWSQDLSVDGWTTGPDGLPQWTDPYTRPGHVRADRLGGAVDLTLPPPDAGPATLFVRSLDRAGNPSPTTSYRFYVPSTMPTVTGLPNPVLLDTPFTLRLAPNASLAAVDSYTVQVNYDPPQTVPAAADGTASVTLALARAGGSLITVRSHSPNGWVSSSNRLFAYVDTSPTVSSETYPEDTGSGATGGGPGIAGTFTFAPKVRNTASYTYSLDFGPETTVAAAADGTAQISWAPDSSGSHTVYVYSTDRDGRTYETYYYYFTVN
ncbi:hypothetical protein KSE_65410 [Kitasatospora setae KM-6054]|uniref:DNRLRE domain-containing protein n=1 Tax=Kitasatospora setae (strain ATCC 33774 / DSM 43861 / JCM 3304 / KCC A-0304 / NBRC 14216 / KM-6054) TaxID=452652 RepID=E4N2B6_KITSK|nr:hypothetical protein KSE_65410 [Kitasatospora setae KM-6054]